jgi:hypothetical protein
MLKIYMFILQTMRHAPERCPLSNPTNLDIMTKWLENLEISADRYNIKVIGVWTDRAGHTSYAVFDAPGMIDFTKFEIDLQNIPMITINSVDKRVVTSIKETIDFFKEYKTATQQQ